MKRLLACITQRNVRLPGGGLRDCLDHDWSLFLDACGVDAVPVPTRVKDPAAFLDRLKADGVILSGGNDVSGFGGEDPAPERDILEEALVAACVQRGMPVLGVCRGMQMLNVLHGGRVRRVPGHAGTTHPMDSIGDAALPGLPAGFAGGREANSYHHFGMTPEDLGSGLTPLAMAPDGTVEAIRHASLPLFGTMWHPERFSPPDAHDIAFIRAILCSAAPAGGRSPS